MSRRMSRTRRLMLVLFLNLALITAQVAVGVAAHSAESDQRMGKLPCIGW